MTEKEILALLKQIDHNATMQSLEHLNALNLVRQAVSAVHETLKKFADTGIELHVEKGKNGSHQRDREVS